MTFEPQMSYFNEGEWQEHYLNALRHSRPEPSPYLYKDYKREVKGQLTPFQRAKLTEFLPSIHKTVSTVLILGAGGVTSWLIPQLIKTLYASRKAREGDDEINVYLVDGDQVTSKNLLRQNFIPQDLEANKAEVLAERYNEIYPGIHVIPVPKYFYHGLTVRAYDRNNNEQMPDNYVSLESLRLTPDIVINALDNEVSKTMLDMYVALSSPNSNLIYMTIGCHAHGGSVTTFRNKSGFYALEYPEQALVDDGEIETFSCADMANENPEQTFNSNSVGATIANTILAEEIAGTSSLPRRVSYVSTSNVYSQVESYDDAYIHKTTGDALQELLSEVREYLRKRDWQWKRSSLTKLYQGDLKIFNEFYDIKAILKSFNSEIDTSFLAE